MYATNPGTIDRAAHLLKEGYLVVFPTDTVYGVGAGALDEEAVGALYRVKERPPQKAIPILLADAGDVEKVAKAIPDVAGELMDRFWPGPLTLVVPRRQDLPANLSPTETIAVRIPDSDVARGVIRAAGGAVATTSANRSGQAPARDAQEALRALGGLVAAVVDDGPAAHGVPSTIVDCTVAPPKILRDGALSAATLALDTA